MATTYDRHRDTHMALDMPETKLAIWAVPLGRFLYSFMFIMAMFTHFNSEMVGYAANNGVPMPNILVPLSGIMAGLGGLSLLLGYKARLGAILIILFLVPVSLMMHDFWNIQDPAQSQQQMAAFMKNVSMLGAAIFFACIGAGPLSIDNKRR